MHSKTHRFKEKHRDICLLQEFDIVALFHILSSLLAASLSDALQLKLEESPDIIVAVLEVILTACVSCDVQNVSSLTQSTSI